jgi:hypothetical protein
MRKAVDLYLLAVASGSSLDPKTLVRAAKCFSCIPKSMQEQVQLYLLCQIANFQGGGGGGGPTPPAGHTYTTNFPNVENPLSEGGNWINGGTTGLDWSNCESVFSGGVHYAAGLQNGLVQPVGSDATAVLSGAWLPNQSASAVFHGAGVGAFKEAELRLRTIITPHSITGYEIDFSASAATPYIFVVRWNGALGDFTDITPGPPDMVDWLHDGDVVFASIIGNNIIVKLNGATIYNFTDNSFATGSPGIGFSVPNTSGVDTTYGFSSFTAIDGL